MTTDTNTDFGGGDIGPGFEYWKADINPDHNPAAEGDQYIEMSGFGNSALYQDVVTTPGETIYWRLAHRGRRGDGPGNDVMNLWIGSPTQLDTNYFPPTVDPDEVTITGLTPTTISDGPDDWAIHKGSYTVPPGQTLTRFVFVAVSVKDGNPPNGSGNHLDDIFFGTAPCDIVSVTTDHNTINTGSDLTIDVNVKNQGGDISDQTKLSVPIPAGTTFIPGSMEILDGPNVGPKSDTAGDDQADYDSTGNGTVVVRLGGGANAIAGGSLSNDSILADGTTVRFKVKVVSDDLNDGTMKINAEVNYYNLLHSPAESLTSTGDVTIDVTNNASVTFNSNGGSAVTSQTVIKGTNASAPAAPTRAGYTFAGWYTDSELTLPFDFDTPITSDITLYAKWAINSYTVTFETQGGSAVPSMTADFSTTIAEPAAPTRAGYTFAGWFKDAAGTIPWNFATDRIPASDITLYAAWTLDAPFAPEINSITSGDLSVSLSWTSVPLASGYRIYQSVTQGVYGTLVATVTDTVYQVNGLTNGTEYFFAVTAINAGGESAKSNQVSAIPQVSIPGVPMLHPPVAGNGQVSLNWSPVTGAAGYKIYQSVTESTYGSVVATVTGAVYQQDIAGLVNGTTYYFFVKATNPGGDSPASNVVSATPMTVPAAPSAIMAVAGNGQATVSFNIPEDDGGSPITGYEVWDQYGNMVATGVSSPITVTGLTNGTRYIFTVKAINSAGESLASGASHEVVPSAPSDHDDTDGGEQTGPESPDSGTNDQQTKGETKDAHVDVLVNGKAVSAGTATTETVNHQQVTTITVDPERLDQRLAIAGQGAVIGIPVLTDSDVVKGTLNGQMVKNMEQKEAVVKVITENASYTIPAGQINIDAVAKQLGSDIALQDIEVQIEISSPAADQLQFIENTANNGKITIMAPPENFSVKGIYNGANVDISHFNAYVERTIAIPDGVDPGKITTAVVVEPDGTVRHVPTNVSIVNGQYTAVIHSLTNSTYALIWNPLEFQDVASHWAKNAINDMGARKIVYGVGGNAYEPDRDVTRAEFAAIILRALGIRIVDGETPFSDVKKTNPYAGVVHTAYAYHLISGYEDGTFRPMDRVSREQAMVILAKAMEVTKLTAKLHGKSHDQLLRMYNDADQVSGWATSSVTSCLQAGIAYGRSNTALDPKANVTRAEVAVMVQRLLQNSQLIN
ncbi:MAG TPA: InlB B-repeat-containing protein [Bacilli bacterium]